MTEANGSSTNDTEASRAERRHVTVLFSDLVKFTPLSERLGEEAIYELVQRLTTEQERIINRHGGAIRSFGGDGFMALFGAPEAREDAAQRACDAALGIQQRMRDLASELKNTYGRELTLRIGINTGPAVVGQVSEQAAPYSALGDNVNLAARLESAATPGTVAISSATHELIGHLFECEFVGDLELKGKSEPQAVYRCLARKVEASRFDRARSRGLSNFVGREAELRQLIALWEDRRDGEIRVASLIGEAGIGKSRLIHEFRQSIADDGPQILRGDCLSSGSTASYLPFIMIVRQLFEIGEAEPALGAADKIKDGLAGLGMASDESLPYLLNLLGLTVGTEWSSELGPLSSPELVREHTKGAIIRLIAAHTKAAPTLMIIEDLHWIDSASEEVLKTCVAEQAAAPLMIVCTMRPSYRPPWSDGSAKPSIHLTALGDDGMLALIKERLGDSDISDDIVKFALDKADGNPLFVEEIANYWLARRDEHDHLTSATGAPDFNLPSSLENLLMERVGQLDEGPKNVLRTASVVGRRFSADLVKEAGKLEERFGDNIETLELRELVYPGEHGYWADYLFKHALVQDAVYNSILQTDRKGMHARVAEVIEHHFGNQVLEVAEVLAAHYEIAGNADKAIRYMQMAGDKAFRLFSLKEADDYYRDAARLIDERDDPADDKRLGEILTNWMQIHCWRLNFAEMRQFTERNLTRIERGGETRELSRLLQWMGEAYLSGARFEESHKALTRALEIAERLEDRECATFAKVDLLYLAVLSPDRFPRDYVAKRAPEILSQAERDADHYHRWFAGVLLFDDRFSRGHMAEVRELTETWPAFAEATSYPPAVTFSWWARSFVALIDGEMGDAVDYIDKARDIAYGETEREFMAMTQAVILVVTGQAAEGLETLAELSRFARETENNFLLNWSEIYYGLALASTGDLGAGVKTLEDAAEMFAIWGNTPRVAEAHWILGQIYLLVATDKERPTLAFLASNWRFLLRNMVVAKKKAREHFERCIELATESGCVGLIAHSHMCLGRLALASKDRVGAQELLAQAKEDSTGLGWVQLDREIEEELSAVA